ESTGRPPHDRQTRQRHRPPPDRHYALSSKNKPPPRAIQPGAVDGNEERTVAFRRTPHWRGSYPFDLSRRCEDRVRCAKQGGERSCRGRAERRQAPVPARAPKGRGLSGQIRSTTAKPRRTRRASRHLACEPIRSPTGE